jgi:hypothetical protein
LKPPGVRSGLFCLLAYNCCGHGCDWRQVRQLVSCVCPSWQHYVTTPADKLPLSALVLTAGDSFAFTGSPPPGRGNDTRQGTSVATRHKTRDGCSVRRGAATGCSWQRRAQDGTSAATLRCPRKLICKCRLPGIGYLHRIIGCFPLLFGMVLRWRFVAETRLTT